MFRSAPPCEGDPAGLFPGSYYLLFRSAPPCEGDREVGSGAMPSTDARFDPRPRVRATRAGQPGWMRPRSFDPRPRVRATRLRQLHHVIHRVSIRAPV